MIYDYVIVGTGVAGLNLARNIPTSKKVLIVCKKNPWECNTFYAQGGITTATDQDDIISHIQDTTKAGAGLCDKKAVEILSTHSKEVIDDLIESGFLFDKNVKGNLAYTKEAAHSKSRVLHADGDATGRMLHKFLLDATPHIIQVDSLVIDLLIQDDVCYGVHLIHERKDQVIYAHNTILASGGVGAIYKYHTNTTTISGDIQGICLENNIKLENMEMIQFHPTVFIQTPFARKTLLSEALRGEGACIEDENKKRFLFDYHTDGELAPRDIVSRAIYDYHKKTNLNIYLSFDSFTKKDFAKRFPNIYKNLFDLGYNLPFERVPITPAFHYIMGGIKTTLDTKVQGFQNLYAIGESASSGVHGANRLASNSLLEGLVFSRICADVTLRENFKIDKKSYNKGIKHFTLIKQNDKNIKNSLRETMWDKAGIVRTKADLQEGLDTINKFLKQDIGRLLYLRLLSAKSIFEASLKRSTSLGAHYIKKGE